MRFGLAGLGRAAIVAAALMLVLASSAAAQTTTYTAEETIPVPPASNYAGGGGGDGWAIELSDDEVFNVFHHDDNVRLSCHKQSDASECYPARTILDANGNNFFGGATPSMYLDEDTGKLYVYTSRGSDNTAGVLCVDTELAHTDPNPFCGYTPLTPPGEANVPGGYYYGVTNAVLVGSKWYAFNAVYNDVSGARNNLMCFDVSTLAACAGQPYAINVGTTNPTLTFGIGNAIAAIGTRVIVPVRDGNTGLTNVACFDTVTAADCGGAFPIHLNYEHTYGAPFPMLSDSGEPTGFCMPQDGLQCFSLTGTPVVPLPNLDAVVPGNEIWNGPAVTIGPRMYLAIGGEDYVVCYDYSTQASCANFPHPTPGAGYIYTVNPDPQRPACLWVNADYGSAQIQNFDAFSGGACGQGAIRVLSSQLVVPKDECQPATYKKFEVLDPARNEYTDGTVSFADSGGNDTGIPPQQIDSNGAVDLTGLGLENVDSPQFLITLNGTSGTPSEVTVRLTWESEYDPDCIDDETEVSTTPTSVTTSLSGGGQSGPSITVPAGTPVKDSATLAGDHKSTADGTVKYTVYSNANCTTVAANGGTHNITTQGQLPDSSSVTLNNPGTYYWVAEYSGDAENFDSKSSCGSEVQTVTAAATEGPPGDPTCSDNTDNDGDGNIDGADADCQPPPSGTDLCFGKVATITGSGVVTGTNGNDVIITGNGADTVDGRGGNDLICTHGGDDFVRGGTGNDQISAGNGNDNAGGQAGNDLVQGVNGNDEIQGSEGDDTLRAGFGNDKVNGGDGADRLFGDENNDLLDGGAGAPDSCDGGTGADSLTAAHGCESVSNVP